MRRPQKCGPSSTFLHYLVESNYVWKMGQIFVAFSEYLNFISNDMSQKRLWKIENFSIARQCGMQEMRLIA